MPMGLLGKKIGMTQVFDKNGNLVPVTLIEAGPCFVVQIRSQDKDGYTAIQVGFDQKPKRKATKPEIGHVKAANIEPVRIIREFRVHEEDVGNYSIGQQVTVEMFKEGEKVDISGISKGRGFAGTIQRFHTTRGGMSHGSTYHRRPGSMSGSSDPAHVFKGKVGAGHMGNKRCTIPNLKVISTDKERNILMIKGSVPGAMNSYVMIRKTNKMKRR